MIVQMFQNLYICAAIVIKKVDVYGRNLLQMCKELDLRIVNGSYGSDSQVGNFTCHKPKGESCVDYLIIALFRHVYFPVFPTFLSIHLIV